MNPNSPAGTLRLGSSFYFPAEDPVSEASIPCGMYFRVTFQFLFFHLALALGAITQSCVVY